MSEHNLHEIGPAAVAGVVAKGSKVMGAVKTVGKVAKKAAGLMSGGSEDVETTEADDLEKRLQQEEISYIRVDL